MARGIDRPWTRLAVTLTGVGVLAVLAIGTPSSAAPGAENEGSRAAAGTPALSHPLRLVTGEMLRISDGPDGRPGVLFADAEQAARSYLRYVDPSGGLHVVPESALPYLGDELDADLFAATDLVRAGIGDSPTDVVPVVVTYAGSPVDVPGVTVTRPLPEIGGAAGFVDADGADRFGTALAALDDGEFFAGVQGLWLDDGTAPDPKEDETAGPQSTVTVEVVPPSDVPQLSGWVAVLGLDTGSFDIYNVAPGSMTLELELVDSRYSMSFYGGEQLGAQEFRIYTVTDPEVTVAGATDVLLDATTTIETTYEIDADPTLVGLDVTTVRFGDVGSVGVGWSALFFEDARAFLAPTDPVTTGTFDQVVSWTGYDDDRFYTLPIVMPVEIPDDLHFVLGPEDLAEIVSHYSSDVDTTYYVGRFAYTIAGGGSPITPNPAPGTRTDVVTVAGVLTSALVALDPGVWITYDRPAVPPMGGTSTDEDWITRPIRPAVPPGLKGGPPNRTGDDINMTVLTFVDPDYAYGWADPGVDQPTVDTVTSELRADGEVVYEGTELRGDPIPVGPDPATFKLTLDVVRDADWWRTSTETSTTWTFESEHEEKETLLDILQVDYDVELDPYNHTDAPLLIRFRPFNLASPDEETITDLTAEWSVDDGATWHDVNELFENDGWWEGGIGGSICNGECTLPVTLRVTAQDASGATIEQTITRAFMATFVESTPTPTSTSPEPTETPTTSPPTDPPTTDPTTPVPSTTLPDTGGGSVGALAMLGGLTILVGGAALLLARRRLTT